VFVELDTRQTPTYTTSLDCDRDTDAAAAIVAVVNTVVVAACAGLVLTAAGVNLLAFPLACGAVIGAGAFSLHERHQRRASAAYSGEAVDRAAIFVPPSQQADAA